MTFFFFVSLMSTLQQTLAADWKRTSLSNELAWRKVVLVLQRIKALLAFMALQACFTHLYIYDRVGLLTIEPSPVSPGSATASNLQGHGVRLLLFAILHSIPLYTVSLR
jgi:hypothetical protein